MQKGVLMVTTKLKRYKYLMNVINIISFPIRFPLVLIYVGFEKSTKFLESLVDLLDGLLFNIRDYIIHKYNWNGIAKEQYKINKDKFK
jgi:hypothetical protein